MKMVRKLRLDRGWSQDQLAQMSGLSTRTIQRVERGQNIGLESLKSLACVLEVELSDLYQESPVVDQQQKIQAEAIEYVRDIKGFYTHLLEYALVTLCLLVFNLFTSPDNLWVKWVFLGWGIGVVSHGLNVFEVVNIFGPSWEKRQIAKRLGKEV